MTDPISKARETLEWYREQAFAMNRYTSANMTEAMMAVVTSLSLDSGERARNALSTLPLPMTEAELVGIMYDQAMKEERVFSFAQAESAIRALAARGLLSVKGE